MATMASRSNAIAALVTVGAVLVAVGRILVTGRMDRISWAASGYLGWQLLFGMAVGAGPAHASDLGRFVSYDGRVFVAFLPFLAYGTIRTVHADLELLRRLLRWTVVANLALFAGGLLHVVPGVVHKGHYYGFTSSHHVPGLFFGVVAVLLAVAPSSARLVSDRVFALGAVLLVGGSGSRTSAVGLLLAAIYLVWSARSSSTHGTRAPRLYCPNGMVTAMPPRSSSRRSLSASSAMRPPKLPRYWRATSTCFHA